MFPVKHSMQDEVNTWGDRSFEQIFDILSIQQVCMMPCYMILINNDTGFIVRQTQ